MHICTVIQLILQTGEIWEPKQSRIFGLETLPRDSVIFKKFKKWNIFFFDKGRIVKVIKIIID